MDNKNTIEFNGKVYDASTGILLKSELTSKRPKNKSKTSDGFIKTKQPANLTQAAPKKPRSPKPSKSQPTTKRLSSKHQGHKPSRSNALMRTGVNKPSSSGHPIDRIQVPTKSKPIKQLKAAPVAARLSINERRLAHAQQINQSRLISRFKPLTAGRSIAKFEPLQLKKPTASNYYKPHAKTAQFSTTDRLDNILSDGLARANSHEQPAPSVKGKRSHKLKRKWLIITTVSIIVLAVSGLVTAY